MSDLVIGESVPFVLDEKSKQKIQQSVSDINIPKFTKLHTFPDVPEDFVPWGCDLSPSALYSCSLKCRKNSGIKTPEVKWVSIRRWVTTTACGINLPEGVYLSVKRKENYIAFPKPNIQKIEYILLMFPYGNVWSQIKVDEPITEEWMWTICKGMTMLERLMRRDAANPLNGYFKSVHSYLMENPDQVGIHLKRKRKVVML